jgi:hypothetical protein
VPLVSLMSYVSHACASLTDAMFNHYVKASQGGGDEVSSRVVIW